MGVDSEFCNVEALVTGLVDNWPRLLRPHRKKFAVLVCVLSFCAGLPMCTQVKHGQTSGVDQSVCCRVESIFSN